MGPSDGQPLPPKLKITAVSVVVVEYTASEGSPALLHLLPLQRPAARAPCTLQSGMPSPLRATCQWAPLTSPGAPEAAQRGQHRLQEQKEHLATHGPGDDRVRETLCWGPVRRVWRCARLRKPQAGRRAGAPEAGFTRAPAAPWGRQGVGRMGAVAPAGSTARQGRSGGCRDGPASRVRLSLTPQWRRVAGTLALDTLRDNIGVVRDQESHGNLLTQMLLLRVWDREWGLRFKQTHRWCLRCWSSDLTLKSKDLIAYKLRAPL